MRVESRSGSTRALYNIDTVESCCDIFPETLGAEDMITGEDGELVSDGIAALAP